MQVHRSILYNSLILFSGIFVNNNPAFSQIPHFNFRNYTKENGLEGNKITAVYQDQQGFMWIGSDKGLNRFDGQNFQKNITEASNTKYFKLNDVRVIAENNHLLWAGTKQGGVVLFQNDKLYGYIWKDIRYPQHTLLSNEITALLSAHNNEMWIGTAKGISVYKNKQEHVINIDSSAVKSSLSITCLTEDNGNNIWAGTKDQGILVFDQTNKKLIAHLSFHDLLLGSQDSVNYILAGKKDTIWICTSNGLKIILAGLARKVETVPLRTNELDASHIAIKKIIQTRENEYWLATQSSGILIAHFSKLQLTPVKVSATLRNDALLPSINDLFADKEQGIWIGQDSALSYYHPTLQKFFSYNYAHGNNQPIKNIFSIYTEDHVKLLLGTNAGLYLYDDSKETYNPVLYKGASSKPQFFYCFYKDEAGLLICGTDAGLKKIEHDKDMYSLTDAIDFALWKQLKNKKITCITPFADSLLLFGSDGQGLFAWNKKRNRLTQFTVERYNPFSILSNTIHAIFVDSKNKIFEGTDKGISIYDPESGNFKNYSAFVVSSGYRSIKMVINDFYDDGQNLWIGSDDEALIKFEPVTGQFAPKKWLSKIYRIMKDEGKNIWASGNQGILYVNPYTDDHQTITHRIFGKEDGIENIEFNPYAGFQKDDWIYFGTNSGVTLFKPSAVFADNNFSPPIAFAKTSVIDVDKNISIDLDAGNNNITLLPQQKILQVEFAAMSYVSPVHNEYSYWMEGLNKQWVNIGNQQRVTFNYLPPGNYTLHVRASNNNKTWNMDGAKLKIIMQPYYWQTTWFKILVWFGIGCLLFLIFNLYTRTRLKKQKLMFEKQMAVQEERKRISSEMHDDIGSGLSSLRLYLDMLKMKMGEEQVNKEVEKASETTGELMQQVREIVWAFNPGNDTLENLLLYIRRYFVQTLESLPFTTEIHFPSLIPEKGITGNVRRSIFLCVKEAVNNIIKHSHATHVVLTITIKDKLSVSIKDDGEGFSFSERNKEEHGNGLMNMQTRMDAVKGKFIFNNHKGTEVRFEIPVKES